MKNKCWQGECEEGKKVCCFDCENRNSCEDVCYDMMCRKEMTMTKGSKREKWIMILVSIMTAVSWWSGLQAIMSDKLLSYGQVALMGASIMAMLFVFDDEGDEE